MQPKFYHSSTLARSCALSSPNLPAAARSTPLPNLIRARSAVSPNSPNSWARSTPPRFRCSSPKSNEPAAPLRLASARHSPERETGQPRRPPRPGAAASTHECRTRETERPRAMSASRSHAAHGTRSCAAHGSRSCATHGSRALLVAGFLSSLVPLIVPGSKPYPANQ